MPLATHSAEIVGKGYGYNGANNETNKPSLAGSLRRLLLMEIGITSSSSI